MHKCGRDDGERAGRGRMSCVVLVTEATMSRDG